jgi:site-specific recombinase XerD
MGITWDMLGIAEVTKAAGVRAIKRPWHALRHTFASHFMMRGGNILTLQKLLGHATLEMTLIYAHLSPDHLAGEIARLNFTPPVPAEVVDLAEVRRKKLIWSDPL